MADKREGKMLTYGEVEGDDLLTVSVSRANSWRKCQQLHDWKYVEEIVPTKKILPLTRGSWLHSCLEARDKGEDWLAVLKELKVKEYDPLFAEEKAVLGPLPTECFRIMRNYMHHFKNDKFDRTITTEIQFKIRIPGTNFVFHGIIDRIVRDQLDRVWCMEHKTVKRPPSDEARLTDIQTGMYLWAMRLLAPQLDFKAEEVGGVVFDYLITKPPTEPYLLKAGGLSHKNIYCDRYTFMAAIKKHGLDVADYADMWPKIDKNPFFIRQELTRSNDSVKNILDDFIRTCQQIKAISGKYSVKSLGYGCEVPRCSYRDLCIIDLENGDTKALIETMFEKRRKR